MTRLGLDTRAFWQLLENATWVVWDERFQHCLVGVPGEGYRLYRYGREWVTLLAEGEEAERIARAVGVADAA